MKKADGFYLYQVGAALQKIKDLKYNWSESDTRGASYQEALFVLKNAKDTLEKFLGNETYRLKICQQKGEELASNIGDLLKVIDADAEKNKLLSFKDIWPINTSLDSFEAVLSSEFGLLDLYVITKKGGYDISELMMNGEACFPSSLQEKVPECISDIRAATKCIAVGLNTAAAFHLHRANETVLHRYWDIVTGGEPRPKKNSMGGYISKLEDKKVGNKKVISALKDLKDLHRNPTIHPGNLSETSDEAIALMNHIYTVIMYMLKEIPEKKEESKNYGGMLGTLLTNVDASKLDTSNSSEKKSSKEIS